MGSTLVTIAQGALQGTESSGILQFRGIPYAAPPVGERRFRAPEAHEGWDGIRDATKFGSMSVQESGGITAFLGDAADSSSEDCLFLNVYTPSCDD